MVRVDRGGGQTYLQFAVGKEQISFGLTTTLDPEARMIFVMVLIRTRAP